MKMKKSVAFSIFCIFIFTIIPVSLFINTESVNPKPSAIMDIEIYSPEATTYDGPMEGYYPGTYGLEDSDYFEENWVLDEVGGSVSIKNEVDGHKKVLDIYDNSAFESVAASNTFSGIQDSTVEFWFYLTSSSLKTYIKFFEAPSSQIIVDLRLFDGWISYLDQIQNGIYQNIAQYEANRWYHCGLNFKAAGLILWLNEVPTNQILFDSNGESYEELYPYLRGAQSPPLNKIEFSTEDSHQLYHLYLDAIGYSWDSTYETGDNRYEGILLEYSLPPELVSAGYTIDDETSVTLPSKCSKVIPMITGGQHTIVIEGFDGDDAHESYPIEFTIVEILDWGIDAINAERVWGGSEDAREVLPGHPNGTGVNVLVIDSGIDINHPDLSANYKGGYDFAENDTIPEDELGHGTHCAGIIAATDNEIGMIGVAPKANLYVARDGVINSEKSHMLEAIYWAIGTHQDGNSDNDIDIISISTSFGDDISGEDTIEAACDAAYNNGIIIVGATDPINPLPANFSSVIGVGAVGLKYGEYVKYFDSGNETEVDVVAPGVGIYSTFPNDDYEYLSGTSMATPMVAGVIALILSAPQNTELYNLQGSERVEAVKECLFNTATSLPEVEDSGHGLVNPVAAIDYNFPGSVAITSPLDGSFIIRGADKLFQANAVDHDGIDSVQFRVDSGSWQTGQFNPSTGKYEWLWSNTGAYGAGWHTVTCKLTDNDGITVTDSISVELITPTKTPSSYTILKGTWYQGNIMYVYYDDGNCLAVRDTSAGWLVYSSVTRFYFNIGSNIINEKIHIGLNQRAGTEKLRIYYTDGSYTPLYNLGSDTVITLNTNKKVDFVNVEHVSWWVPEYIFIDYLWISYYFT